MPFCRSIRNFWKKSEAAVVVHRLLALQVPSGAFKADPAATATQLVSLAWNGSPEIFDGRFGPRPHRATVAALAFAYGTESPQLGYNHRQVFATSLGCILHELSLRRKRYALNRLDGFLLEATAVVFATAVGDPDVLPFAAETRQLLGRH